MNVIESIIAGTIQPGIYRVSTHPQPGEIDDLLNGIGWRSFYLDGRLIQDKDALFAGLAVVMDFPWYFGRNWDALDEVIRDLESAPAAGYLLMYDYPQLFATQHPQEWGRFLSILRNAIAEWGERNVPLFVLLGETQVGLGDIAWMDS